MEENEKQTWEFRVDRLCAVLHPHIERGAFAHAIAACAAALIHRDHSQYGVFSHAISIDAVGLSERVRFLQDALAAGRFETGDGLADLRRVALEAPLALLKWLDLCLLLVSVGTSLVPAWLDTRTVMEVTLTAEELSALILPPSLASLFVFRRLVTGGGAPVHGQHVDPERFLPNWVVVPSVPDLNQSNRRVTVCTADTVFASICEGVRDRGRVRIYLAEFEHPPMFDSAWADGDRARSWQAVRLRNAEVIETQTLAHLARAVEQSADVVVFPELTMPEELLSAVSDWLSEHSTLDGHGHSLGWVVAGSFHVHGGGAKPVNRTSVLDRFGNRITLRTRAAHFDFSHVKMTSVDLEETMGVIEDAAKGTELLLAHTPIGPQAVVICLDLAQAGSFDKVPLEFLPLRWLWVPSLSRDTSAHQTRAKDFCKQRCVTTACANQAAATFGDGAALEGAMGTSFVWANHGRKSRSLQREAPDPSGDVVPSWQVFQVNL